MRSRSVETTGVWPGVYSITGQYYGSIYSAQSDSVFGYNPGPRLRYKSTISDEVSPEHAHPRPYNSVIHTSYVAAQFNFTRTVDFDQQWWGVTPPPLTYRCEWPMMVLSTGYESASVPWKSMVDELASLAEGSTDNSAMLPVTLLESVKTIAMLRNPFNLLKPNFRRSVRKLTARSLASKGSSVWLEGYYGWKSFYQDTEQIAKATAQFLYDDHQRHLEKLGERLCVRDNHTSFREVYYNLGTAESTWKATYDRPSYPITPPGHHARLVNIRDKTLAVIGCRQFQDVSSRMARTKRFLSLYGLSPNWRTIRDTIWEVIPFSFVIDWFVDTRGLWAPLNKWRLGQLDIKDIGYSTNVTSTYDVDLNLQANPFFNSSESPWYRATPSFNTHSYERSITPGRVQTYSRFPGFPAGDQSAVVSFNTKGLSFIRSINGAALIVQLLSKKA